MFSNMKFIPVFLFLLLGYVSFAQQGRLCFENKDTLLDNLKADDKPTAILFRFTNSGEQPVIISRVSPVTSQIKAEWDKSPIAPGQSSSIKITFNSTSFPTHFSYSIMVFSNASNSPEKLYLKGKVVENPDKPFLLYRYSMDGLKFRSSSVNFGKIYSGTITKDTVYFYNSLDTEVTLSVLYAPSYLHIQVPEQIKPKEKGMLILAFDAIAHKEYGYIYDNIIFIVNDKDSYRNRLAISATIKEDFTRLTPEELANAPVAHFREKDLSFGEIKPKEKGKCDFILENKGKSELIIRKTKSSCGCTAVVLGKNTVAPGKSMTIRAIFDPSGKSGRQYKTITVITNDPKNPEINLTLSGNIKK